MGDKLQPVLPHALALNQRSKLTMTGVTEVVSFDELAVVLHTALGTLVVQGRDLQLKALSPDGGNVAIEGTISAVVYEEPKKPGGWLRRLLG